MPKPPPSLSQTAPSDSTTRPPARPNLRPSWRSILLGVLALFVLNAGLSMTNWWPTPFVELDARIAPEFIYCWVGLLAWLAWKGSVGKRALAALTVFYFLLVVGRYFDTTAPALFGRAINLYWDGLQIPLILGKVLKAYPWWAGIALVLGLVALIALVYLLLHWAWKLAAHLAAPFVLRSKIALGVTAFLLIASVANLFGVQATWPYISRPVIPTYAKQTVLLFAIASDTAQSKVLPASPPFTSDLKALQGKDFHLFFLESYGAVTFDNPDVYKQLAPGRALLEQAVAQSGRYAASAFVKSPTFGGGSELAHVALQTGIDTTNPLRHDVIITTDRPTLSRHFHKQGYTTAGIYPGLTWDWPEKAFYGYDHFFDTRDFKYKGPKIGYWEIPDQVALARYRAYHPIAKNDPPRMVFYLSITSHLPFHPVPPYEKDWSRMLSDTPYDQAVVDALQASKTNWLNLMPGYIGMINYNYQWLSGYLQQPHERDFVLFALGDHQPAASVSGPNASWDVPVHVIASNPALIERFTRMGFTPGLWPRRQAIANMDALTSMILQAFDSKAPAAAESKAAGLQ
jgi:hypothetical protein